MRFWIIAFKLSGTKPITKGFGKFEKRAFSSRQISRTCGRVNHKGYKSPQKEAKSHKINSYWLSLGSQ